MIKFAIFFLMLIEPSMSSWEEWDSDLSSSSSPDSGAHSSSLLEFSFVALSHCSAFSPFLIFSPPLTIPVSAHILSDHFCLHLFCIALQHNTSVLANIGFLL